MPSWANTGPIAGQLQNIVNPEFMLQYGPLFVQSEFVGNFTTNSVAMTGTSGGVMPGQRLGQLWFYSSYIQVMYFLSGEHRIYDYQKGIVGRVIPRPRMPSTCVARRDAFRSRRLASRGPLELRQPERQGGRRRSTQQHDVRVELVLESQYQAAIQLRR